VAGETAASLEMEASRVKILSNEAVRVYPPTTAAVTTPLFTNTTTDAEDDEVPTEAVIVTV
jgi:hypothetical protein